MQVLDPEAAAPLETAPPPVPCEVVPREVEEKGSYGQILKSSALVGGSSLLNVVIGMVRTKVLAMLLGPAGFGLFGVYNSIANLTQTFAGMGVNSSGVRQIAEAAGTEDGVRIARTAWVLRRVSLLLGVFGAVILLLFSHQIAQITFGNSRHAASVSYLAVVVFFMLISAGQSALIQGLRRIADLAKISVIGALAGTLLSIPLVYLFRDRGVLPALIVVAATTFLTSWWYSRRIQVPQVTLTGIEIRRETEALLKLGFAFMSSGIMTIGVAYVVRTTVLRKVGMEATGLYQSAWTLGGLYVAFILQAMGADFYPRLTACAQQNAKCNRLVNEQVEVGLLLAGPGVLATLTFAPLAISLFYSARFLPAVDILRWICLGTLLQVVTWPIGFIIIAKAKQTIFFWCEVSWAVVSLVLAWVCIGRFGLKGAGIAFAGSYVFHGALIYTVVRRLSGYRWSAENVKMGLIFGLLTAVCFGGFYVLPFYVAIAFGGLACCLSAAYSIHTLLTMFTVDRLPPVVQRVLGYLRIHVPGAASVK